MCANQTLDSADSEHVDSSDWSAAKITDNGYACKGCLTASVEFHENSTCVLKVHERQN